MTLKSGIFSLLANCVLLGISGGHVQVHHIYLKKYFSSSGQFLDKIFVKNNHHLDFMQGFISTSGGKYSLFSSQKVAKYAKNRFSWLPWKRTGRKKKGVHFSSSFDIRKKYTKFQTILRHVISSLYWKILVLINNYS